LSNVLPVTTSPQAALNGVASRSKQAAIPDRPVAITLSPVDSIDISEEARVAEHLQHDGKVQRIREEIADGTYLHPDKLDIAIERMLRSLEGTD
jgi:hypothetical protein